MKNDSPSRRRTLFERQHFAILSHRRLRIGWGCHAEDNAFIHILLVAFVARPGIIGKLETELIGFGPAVWVVDVDGNDHETIDVGLFARRDVGFQDTFIAHGLFESRIGMYKAAVRGS